MPRKPKVRAQNKKKESKKLKIPEKPQIPEEKRQVAEEKPQIPEEQALNTKNQENSQAEEKSQKPEEKKGNENEKVGILNSDFSIKAKEAIEKLLEWYQNTNQNEKSLFEKVETISLVFTLKKVPTRKKFQPLLCTLPNPIQYDVTEIGFFLSKNKKQILKEKMPPNVTLMTIEHLRKKYSSFEARRKLLNSYHLFLCEEKLTMILKRFLGKDFRKARKYPFPINCDRYVVEQVTKVINSTPFYIPCGTCGTGKIGVSSQTPDAIFSNLNHLLSKVTKHPSMSWANIHQLSIKGQSTPALPFYVSSK